MTQIYILGFLVLVMAGEGYLYYKTVRFEKEPVPIEVDSATIRTGGIFSDGEDSNDMDLSVDAETSDQNGETTNGEGIDAGQVQSFPAELNLKAVFYAQAPFGNWDLPWQEACEEASVLLVANEYFSHNWSREQFNDEILKLVEWQKDRFGDYIHTSVDQTAEILEEYLFLETVIHENPSFEDVQKVINDGHFIIMTFSGKQLYNPNFKNGGPMYHVVLVKGYKEGKIITHDVGTKNGENYVYTWDVISNALHDYSVPIENGAKRMIEVLPPAF